MLFRALLQADGETRTGLVDLDDSVQQTVIDGSGAAFKKRLARASPVPASDAGF
jgi:hypothetical protein